MHFGKVIREMRLEAFSQRFARGLLERHPEWLPFLGAYEEEDDAGQVVRTLEVRVPSESPCYEEPLLIRVSPPETCTQGTFHRPADVPNAKPVVTRVRFTRFEVYLEWAGLHTHLFTEPEKDQDHIIREALDNIALCT